MINELNPPAPSKFHPIRSVPLLALVLLAYNVAMWSGHNFHSAGSKALFNIPLISGASCAVGWNEFLVMFGLIMLFVELVKSTRSSFHSTFEHVLSMVVFILFLIEFLITPGAGTSTFLMLGFMSLIDVMGGYAISIAVARRDLSIGGAM